MFSTRSKRTAGHPEVGRWRLSYIRDRMPMRMVSVVLRRLCVFFDSSRWGSTTDCVACRAVVVVVVADLDFFRLAENYNCVALF